MLKIFLLSFDLQRDEIEAFCFRACGKVSIGSVSIQLSEGLPEMYFLPCRHPTCPHLEREMDEPSAETKDGQFFLRKLKPLTTLVRAQAAESQVI